jgi:hypothetical protein
MLGSMMCSLVVVALMIWCGRVTANFAEERGRSRRVWFLWERYSSRSSRLNGSS